MFVKSSSLTYIISDECPNSGEDSDEDVITDYLGSGHTDCSHMQSIVNGELTGSRLDGNRQSTYTKDKTDIIMSEATEEHLGQPRPTLSSNIQIQHVPIISVTPHSPGLAKHYPVLGNFIISID